MFLLPDRRTELKEKILIWRSQEPRIYRNVYRILFIVVDNSIVRVVDICSSMDGTSSYLRISHGRKAIDIIKKLFE